MRGGWCGARSAELGGKYSQSTFDQFRRLLYTKSLLLPSTSANKLRTEINTWYPVARVLGDSYSGTRKLTHPAGRISKPESADAEGCVCGQTDYLDCDHSPPWTDDDLLSVILRRSCVCRYEMLRRIRTLESEDPTPETFTTLRRSYGSHPVTLRARSCRCCLKDEDNQTGFGDLSDACVIPTPPFSLCAHPFLCL